MSTYMKLDGLIVGAIRGQRSPHYFAPVCAEAERIAVATGRPAYRIIDARLQALRKQGLIVARRKSKCGWVLAVTP